LGFIATESLRWIVEQKQPQHDPARPAWSPAMPDNATVRSKPARLLVFTLSESLRIVGQLRREQMQAREISLAVRFNDFTEVGTNHRYQHPQFLNSVINTTLEAMFRDCMQNAFRPVRQIRIAMFNLKRLDTQPTLWGKTDAERLGALDEAAAQLNEHLGKNVLMTGSQLALRKRDAAHITPKTKCPFTPQREMVLNLWGENPP
jgi:hypothetical protein